MKEGMDPEIIGGCRFVQGRVSGGVSMRITRLLSHSGGYLFMQTVTYSWPIIPSLSFPRVL